MLQLLLLLGTWWQVPTLCPTGFVAGNLNNLIEGQMIAIDSLDGNQKIADGRSCATVENKHIISAVRRPQQLKDPIRPRKSRKRFLQLWLRQKILGRSEEPQFFCIRRLK